MKMRNYLYLLMFLWLIGCSGGVDDDIRILHTAYPAARVQALKRLEKSKEPKARRAILDAMDDRVRLVRREAVRIIAQSPTPDTMWALSHRLHDGDPRIRAWAVEGLLRLGTPEAIYRAATALDDPDSFVRERFYALMDRGWTRRDILGLWAARKAWSAMDGIGSPEPGSLAAAVKSLGSIGFAEDMAFVYRALFSKDSFARSNALEVLARTGKPEVLPWLFASGSDRILASWVESSRGIPDDFPVISSSYSQTIEALLARDDVPCRYLEVVSSPDQARHFKGRCHIPENLPPSFRGAVLMAWGQAEAAMKAYRQAQPDEKAFLRWSSFEIWGYFAAWDKIFGSRQEATRKKTRRHETVADAYNPVQIAMKVWDAWLYWNSKWLSDSTWRRLDEVEPGGLPGEKKTPLQRLLEDLAKERMPGTPTELMPSPLPADALAQLVEGARGSKAAAAFLGAMLSTPPAPLMPLLLDSLASLGCPAESRKVVDVYIRSENSEVKAAALRLAAACGKWDAVRAGALDQTDRQTAYAAVDLLAKYGKGKKTLLGIMNTKPFGKAALALARMGVKKAVPLIKKVLAGTFPKALYSERAAYVKALALMGESSVPDTLHPAAKVRLEALRGPVSSDIRKAHMISDPSFLVRRRMAELVGSSR